jgi:peroxiredoxin
VRGPGGVWPLAAGPRAVTGRARRGLATLLGVRLLGVVIAGALAACGASAPPGAGDPAPTFELESPSGQRLSYPGDVRDEVVVMLFWADWCTYCREEIDALEGLLAARRHEGLAVLAVNVGQTPDVVASFLEAKRLSCQVLLDPDSRVAARYAVTLLPATYVIDRAGTIRHRILGRASPEVIPAMVAGLL